MMVIGLTGSIAMGKSETAKMFGGLGVPVFDSDAEVRRLYGKGGDAVSAVARIVPRAAVDGAIDRGVLSRALQSDSTLFKSIESVVHPLVRLAQERFLKDCGAQGHRLVVLDIPLLFETGRQRDVDRIVVVSAPADIQRARALARPGMMPEKLEAILARQLPDAEKRRRAHYVVDTSQGLDDARRQVAAIVDDLRLEAEK